MTNLEIRQISKNYPLLAYCLSTLFMVFVSVHAVQNWPNSWAQVTIPFVCLFTLLLTLLKEFPVLNKSKRWPVEIKFILAIIALGALNVCYSENNWDSFKGMSLFLMSGILIFVVTFFLFRSKQNQNLFISLYAICFFALIIYGLFEFFQQIHIHGERILLFSSNPIPAGSLMILLSYGPLSLLTQTRSGWKRWVLITGLLLGTLVTILIGQRGPLLALSLMVFLWATTRRKGLLVFALTVLVLVGTGYQFRDKIPPQYKNQLLKKETLLVRMEFYHVALDVIKEKPLFGLGFNSSLSRFIPKDYESKIYPRDSENSFYDMVSQLNIFDNMALSFLGETGILFTAAYIGLGTYLIKNKISPGSRNELSRMQLGLLLIVLVGFFAHSMTFDSLKYPHLNWIFHSLLGMLAQNKELYQK